MKTTTAKTEHIARLNVCVCESVWISHGRVVVSAVIIYLKFILILHMIHLLVEVGFFFMKFERFDSSFGPVLHLYRSMMWYFYYHLSVGSDDTHTHILEWKRFSHSIEFLYDLKNAPLIRFKITHTIVLYALSMSIHI